MLIFYKKKHLIFLKGTQDTVQTPVICVNYCFKTIQSRRREQGGIFIRVAQPDTDQLHGFRKNKSTITALYDMVTEIYDSVEMREKVNLILYDFKNAFGCLVPDNLLSKLKKYGLDDLSLSWLKGFFIDRTQYVQLKVFDQNNVQRIIKSNESYQLNGCATGYHPWTF
jgi:hypothetical protein